MATAKKTLTGRCVIDAACYDNLFEHSLNPALAALRKSVPIVHGDWYFEVECLPKNEMTFEEFAQKKHNEEDDDEDDDGLKTEIAENVNRVLRNGMSAADLLNEVSCQFGVFEFEFGDIEIGLADGLEVFLDKRTQFETSEMAQVAG